MSTDEGSKDRSLLSHKLQSSACLVVASSFTSVSLWFRLCPRTAGELSPRFAWDLLVEPPTAPSASANISANISVIVVPRFMIFSLLSKFLTAPILSPAYHAAAFPFPVVFLEVSFHHP